MLQWQRVGAFGNEEGNHTINFSVLHELQERLTDIYCIRTSLNASQREGDFTRRNKSGLLQACISGVKNKKTYIFT